MTLAATTTSEIGFAVIIIVAVSTSITAPLLLSRRMDRQHRQDRAADWARQDAVAAAAAQAARLLENNTRLVAEAAHETTTQLEAIHKAVNSNLTARMVETLSATQAQLTLMQRLIPEPNDEEAATMAQLKKTVAELAAQLADRGEYGEYGDNG